MPPLAIHGARGSFPVTGDVFRRYGGHTSSFSLETPQGILVFDAGTGLSALGQTLAERSTLPPITIFFTHLHLDHLIGLAAFKPLLRPDAQITFMADERVLGDWPKALRILIGAPYWPVDLERLGAHVAFEQLPKDAEIIDRCGIRIRWRALSHPQGCLSYRIESDGKSIVLATDYEFGQSAFDRDFVGFAKDAHVLVHDAQYTPEEFDSRRGWGHCTWEHAVAVAQKAKVAQLVLTSHDPSRTDDAVDCIEALARARFPKTVAARAGLILNA